MRALSKYLLNTDTEHLTRKLVAVFDHPLSKEIRKERKYSHMTIFLVPHKCLNTPCTHSSCYPQWLSYKFSPQGMVSACTVVVRKGPIFHQNPHRKKVEF